MNTTKLWLAVIAATTCISLVSATYAQETPSVSETDHTVSTQRDWGRMQWVFSRIKKARSQKWWDITKHLEHASEFFGELSDAERDELIAEIELLKEDRPSREELKELSDEEATTAKESFRAQTQSLIENYVDAGEVEAYRVYIEEKQTEREVKKAKRKEKRAERKQNRIEKVLERIEWMSDDEKEAFATKVETKLITIQERIESSQMSDEKKAMMLEKVNEMTETLLEALS